MKRLISALLLAGMVSAVSAVSLIDTDFTAPYVNGNIAGQQSWLNLPLTGGFSFEVDATDGVADTAPYAADFNTGAGTNGHYVYQSSSVANLVDDEWSGSMDFSLSTTAYAGTNIALFSGAQEFYQIGLTDTVTNRLLGTDVLMQLRQKDTEVEVTLSKAGRWRTLGRLTNVELGWDPDNPAAPDFQTDGLNLTWTIRKTRTADTYSAVAVISNKTTGVVSVFDPDLFGDVPNLNYDVFSNVYNSASVNLAMGHHPDADEDGTFSLIHIALDSLSVDQTSGNAPVLDAPVLSASGANNLVDLSWSSSLEATSYAVKRSTTSGSGYATLATLGITNAYTDATAVNNTLYYYIVTAAASGVVDVDSNEAVGEPQAAATGLIIDTTFITGEGYASGNLNGQSRWKDADLGASPAFAVTDAAGSGFADSEPYIADFDTTIGNNIYYNRLMSNNVADEWTGSIVFQLKTTPSDGQVIERLLDGTNYSHTVAANAANELFKIGLTADPASGLEFNDANDIFIVVRCQTSGRLDFQLNSVANLVNRFGVLGNDEAGWDPNWEEDVANGPDFQTDPITMNFTIRKPSTPVGSYTLWGEVICNGVTNSSGAVHEYADSTSAFNSDFVYLSMGIDEEASERKALVATNGFAIDDNYEGDPVTVAIDSLSFTKADDQPPILIVPANLLPDVADGTVFLEWDASVEASSYTVRRYPNISGGAPLILSSGLTDLTYTDTGLNNGETYFYTVAADYGVYGEAETAIVPVRPLGKATELSWGYGVTVIGGGRLNFSTTANLTGGVDNYKGTYSGGGFFDTSKLVTSLASQLYGIFQLNDPSGTAIWAQLQIDNDTPFNRLKSNAKLSGEVEDLSSALMYMDKADFTGGVALNLTRGKYSFEAQCFTHTGVAGAARVHAAIRNGTQWYASETRLVQETTTVILDLAAEKWTPFTEADINSTEMMTITNGTPAIVSELNNITGVGYFIDHVDLVQVEGFKVTLGEQATPLQLWTDGFDIYNEDAAADFDYDLDGALNVYEWGLGGDPVDPGNIGISPEFAGMDASGTNLVYVYPRLKSEPRPVYTPMELGDLIYDKPWKNRSSTYTVTVGGDWGDGSGNFEAVTNVVPGDLETKYISLNIVE